LRPRTPPRAHSYTDAEPTCGEQDNLCCPSRNSAVSTRRPPKRRVGAWNGQQAMPATLDNVHCQHRSEHGGLAVL
jgi:hypothetical protein